VPFTREPLDPRLRGLKLRQLGGPLAIEPLALQFADTPYGPYSVYLIPTKPKTSYMIAKAETLF
jgi:hypothetical protein